jgi:hypothetical protein
MNFTPDMLEKVLNGTKTQTRRPVKQGEKISGADYIFGGSVKSSIEYVRDTKGRVKWRRNSIYAVCPGRGKSAVARMIITRIRTERAIDISEADARAEGFDSREAFFDKLRSLYGANVDLEARYYALTFELVQS